jgi:hypothetical protein
MTNENIYSAPQSDVAAVVDQTNEIEIFPRMSAWKVFFLAIPTIGFYPYYWLYSRSKLMNSLPDHSVSMTPATIMLALAALSVPFSILSNVYKDVTMINTISVVLSLINVGFYIVTAFALRRELQHIIQSSGVSVSQIGPLKTFFFNSIYLQYKINECVDARNNK